MPSHKTKAEIDPTKSEPDLTPDNLKAELAKRSGKPDPGEKVPGNQPLAVKAPPTKEKITLNTFAASYPTSRYIIAFLREKVGRVVQTEAEWVRLYEKARTYSAGTSWDDHCKK